MIRENRFNYQGAGGAGGADSILGITVYDPPGVTLFSTSWPAPENEVTVNIRTDAIVPPSGNVLVTLQGWVGVQADGLYAWVMSVFPPGGFGSGPQTGVMRGPTADGLGYLVTCQILLTGLPAGLSRNFRWYHIANTVLPATSGTGIIAVGGGIGLPPMVMMVEAAP